MTTGELPPWAAGPPVPSGPLPEPTYGGPWGSRTAGAPVGWTAPGSWAGPPVPDELLRQLPPPVVAHPPPGLLPHPDQRPALVGLAVTLAVTASLLWVCALSLVLVVAVAATTAMSPVGEDSYVFHALDEVVLRMGDGLWVPLYGFPVASIVTGFCLLARRPWTRVAHSVVGALALGWTLWWLRDSLLPAVVVAVYVVTAVAVLWVPSVGRWYAHRPPRPEPAYELTG